MAVLSLEIQEKLALLSKEELELLRWKLRWHKQSRPKQRAPDLVRPGWRTWGIMTGRGFGKTLTGSQWTGLSAAQTPNSFWAVVAPTHDDVRYTDFEGTTGLMNVIPPGLILDQNKNLPSITLWNKSLIRGFSGDVPDRMRGPQHHGAYIDEFAAWKYPKEALSNLRFGLRLGNLPQLLWTTTPRPRPELKELMSKTDVLITGSLYENRDNLPDTFLEEILQYEGTKIGRQEIHGEVIDLEEMGIVKRSDFRLWPWNKPLPKFRFIIMSLDCATTEKNVDSKTHDPDFTACSVWGIFEYEGKMNVLLLDAWQDRLGMPQLIEKVRRESGFRYGEEDAPVIKRTYLDKGMKGETGRRVDLILIERQGGGRSLMQMLAAEEIMTQEYNPGKADKLQRLHLVSHIFPNKRVWVVESEKNLGSPKTWADPLITQVCSYAGEGSLEHDDLLDTTTQALKVIIDKFTGTLTVSTKPTEKEHNPRRIVNPYAQ